MPETTYTPNPQEQPETNTRKPYHTPQMEDYGAVNELTRSDPTGNFNPGDGTTLYTAS